MSITKDQIFIRNRLGLGIKLDSDAVRSFTVPDSNDSKMGFRKHYFTLADPHEQQTANS